MFVEATPGGTLAKMTQKTIKQAGLKIKVVEKAGERVKGILTKSNPFRGDKCPDDECVVCQQYDGRGRCKQREVIYQVTCSECEERYIGETARSLGERIQEHVKEKSSAVNEHMQKKHEGRFQRIRVRILNRCPGDAMLRQVMESTYIKELQPEMNRKEEWTDKHRGFKTRQREPVTMGLTAPAHRRVPGGAAHHTSRTQQHALEFSSNTHSTDTPDEGRETPENL